MATNIHPWKPSFNLVGDTPGKKVALALQEQLQKEMARRRFGGIDCFTVFDKALSDTVWAMQDSLPGDTVQAKIEVVFDGLRILKRHHPYGEHVDAEILICVA